MENKKSYIITAALILVITLVLEILVGFALTRTSSGAEEKNFIFYLSRRANDDSLQLEALLDEYGELAQSGQAGDAFAEAILADNSLTLLGETYTLTANQVKNLTELPVNYYTLNELTNGAVSVGAFLFVSAATDAGARILLFSPDDYFADIAANFNDRALVSLSGRVLFGTEAFASTVTEMAGIETGELLLSESTAVRAKNGDVSYMLTLSPLRVGDEILFYYATLTDFSIVSAYEKEATTRTALLLMGLFLINAACYCVFAAIFAKSESFVARMTAAKEKYYVVFVDQHGDFKSANEGFKGHFKPDNIFDNIVMRNDERMFASGDNIVASLMGTDGKKHLVSFLVSERRNGYKLVGINAEKLINVGGDTTAGGLLGVETEISRRFETAAKKCERILYGKFEISRLRNLEAMLGKKFGDGVFLAVTQKIKDKFGEIYILEDNHICVLKTEPKQIDVLIRDMNEIMGELDRPVLVDGNLVTVGCRAGFVLADGLMDKKYAYADKCASAALRRVDAEENKNYYVYHESQKKLYVKYMEHDFDIKRLLEEDAFDLEYQPQLSLAENRIVGFEALFRVKKRRSLEVSTQELITYAERSGQMILLGEFIFDKGMSFAKSLEGKNISVSLNVSPIQFMQAGFVDSFLNIYRKYNLKHGAICIEITESFLMSSFEETVAKLGILRNNGVRVHLDDFGMGYSSFMYLKKLPISALKLDREFVDDLGKRDYSFAITKTIIDIAKQLGLESVAEGVETKEQRDILEELGCDVVQGYLIGKSMPESEVRRILDENV